MSSIHDATPLQLAELVKRRERLARIASRAVKEPEVLAEEPVEVVCPPISPEIAEVLRFADPIRDIQIATAVEFGIQRIALVSTRQTKDLILPRQVAMYLASITTTQSPFKIGLRFNGRLGVGKERTTVLHAIWKIKRLILSDPILAARIEAIRNTLEVQ